MRRTLILLLCFLLGATLSAQDTLSVQVLRLLTRDSTWTGLQSYAATVGIEILSDGTDPDSGTANRLYNKGGSLFWNGALVTTAAGVGTVTSVDLAAPAIFSVTGNPITGSGTLTIALAAQVANRVWAGPTSGANAAPTFRALVDLDVPDTITIDGAANVTWASVNKTGSSLADLATRSASDLGSGTLPDGRFPATLPAVSGVNLTALNATQLTSGTVPEARLPAFTGDATSTAGTAALTLASTGVGAGTYGGAGTLMSLTVDAKGRITAASNIAAATHNVLSTTHGDSVTTAVSRGAVIGGNSTPAWGAIVPTTAGQVLRYDGTDTSWSTDGSALTALNASALASGTVAVTRGGTGVTTAPSNGQLLMGNGTGYTLATVAGTTDQITVTNGAGSITLALPQAIATSSTPQFAKLGIGSGAGALAGILMTGKTISHAVVDNGNSSTADTIDLSAGNVQKSTLTDNVTYTFTNPTTGTQYELWLIQDGSGSRTATWPGTVKWAGGAAPTLTTTAAKIDIIHCSYDGANYLCHSHLNH